MEVVAMEKSAPVLQEEPVSDVYRETFLAILPPDEAAAFRAYGNAVENRLLDRPAYEMPTTSYTEAEMRGALADLCFLAGFLQTVGKERAASELPERDWQLAHVAAELAGEVAALAAGLDRELRRFSASDEGTARTDGE
jgi:hypothetical protein